VRAFSNGRPWHDFQSQRTGLELGRARARIGKHATEVGAALASYVRTIRSSGSRFDRFLAGDSSALNAQERIRFSIVSRPRPLRRCHEGPDFTDGPFSQHGHCLKTDHFIDDGRFAISRISADRGAFRLRLCERSNTPHPTCTTAAGDTRRCREFLCDRGRRNPTLDPRIRPLDFQFRRKCAHLLHF
jgi:cytochrome c peroxidase